MHTQHHRTDDLGGRAEVVLFRQAQTGGRESLNALMEEHDGLVHAVVRRQVLGDLPYAEAIQAGRIGLWRAIMRFDPSRGYAFSTYAWPSIVHHVWRAVKVHARASRSESVEAYSEWQHIASADPAALEAAWSVHDTLHELVTRLSGRLQRVIVARYGLDGQGSRFYREIGRHLGVSGERARQLHSEALVWLRHPAHSQHLRSLLAYHSLADYQWAEAEAQRWLRRRGGRYGRP
ncbi:MAG: sigma-70 family RNA polymerase sigma factor [Anaerolineae bacterium]|jgi:RNA polymerase sigma factor (sigma-70 family)